MEQFGVEFRNTFGHNFGHDFDVNFEKKKLKTTLKQFWEQFQGHSGENSEDKFRNTILNTNNFKYTFGIISALSTFPST